MNFTKLFSFVFGIVFIILLYVIIYYALKIMYRDVKNGGKNNGSNATRKYGLEIIDKGSNLDLEEGTVVLVRGEITIGRKEDNTLVLSESFVSGDHAKVYTKNNSVYIEDLDSTNGVFVNDELIENNKKLMSNDIVKIGSAQFRVLRSKNK